MLGKFVWTMQVTESCHRQQDIASSLLASTRVVSQSSTDIFNLNLKFKPI